jgi:CBS-domain-containing membrane protein
VKTGEEAAMKRRAKDVMTRTVVVVRETAPYKEVVRLLDEYRVNALPVVDEKGVLVGIVSEADLLLKEEFSPDRAETHLLDGPRRRHDKAKARGLLAADVMTGPVVSVQPDAGLAETARLLHDRNVKQVPVTTPDGKVAGIVSRRDLLRVFLRSDEDIEKEILDEIVTRTLWMERSAIQVTVADGVVTLQGHVDQRSLAEWLVELVEKVDGVVAVQSELGYLVDDVAIRAGAFVTPWSVYAPGSRPLG